MEESFFSTMLKSFLMKPSRTVNRKAVAKVRAHKKMVRQQKRHSCTKV